MIKAPEPGLVGDQRFDACQKAIELEFLKLVDNATSVGWDSLEVATALVAVSDEFVRSWLFSQD